MHKLTQILLAVRASGKPALLPYLMAGDGGLDKTARLIALYEEKGAAAIEIGIPFSDPVADGPIIQVAGLRAMAAGITLKKVLDWLEALPDPRVPRIIMTYLNPILRLGVDAFFDQALRAQVSAVIIPDLPLEEMELCEEASIRTGIPMIPLASPNTTAQRLDLILEKTDGFIYAVTVSGITGARNGLPESLKNRLAEIRRDTPLPVVAGFGISTVQQIAELHSACDGFVIGSLLVDLAHRNDFEGIRRFMEEAALS